MEAGIGPPGPEDTTWTVQRERERVCIEARQYEQTIDTNTTSISEMAL